MKHLIHSVPSVRCTEELMYFILFYFVGAVGTQLLFPLGLNSCQHC